MMNMIEYNIFWNNIIFTFTPFKCRLYLLVLIWCKNNPFYETKKPLICQYPTHFPITNIQYV